MGLNLQEVAEDFAKKIKIRTLQTNLGWMKCVYVLIVNLPMSK